jgi:hypothetical protein
MLDLIDARFTGGCHIFLADIYDPTDGVGDGSSVGLPDWEDGLQIHAEYNRVIRECAGERDNVQLVPLRETFLGHGSHCTQFWRKTFRWEDPTFWFYFNIEDPNDRGYDAIRRAFLLEMVEVLARNPAVFEQGQAGTAQDPPWDTSGEPQLGRIQVVALEARLVDEAKYRPFLPPTLAIFAGCCGRNDLVDFDDKHSSSTNRLADAEPDCGEFSLRAASRMPCS